jgi:hypothetical protein
VRIFAIANEELARLGCGYAIFVKKFLKSYIAAFGIALSPARVYRMWQRLSPQTTFTRIAGFLFIVPIERNEDGSKGNPIDSELYA